MTSAGLLLAAGASRRFGPENKLLADLWGCPLVCHAADALRSAGCNPLIAVTRSAEVTAVLEGYDIVRPVEADPVQADSLRAGIARARDLGAECVLVMLADMPLVTPAHLARLLDRWDPDTRVATTDGTRRMSPACFPARDFPALLALDGDRGAQTLLRDLPPEALVRADPGMLIDVDTPEVLVRLQARRLHGR